jgi:putative flippase GtrA
MATAYDVRTLVKAPLFQKLFKYSMASVVAIIVSQASLLLLVGVINMEAVLANTIATSLAAIPSYEMNRKWAWGKSGKSHLWKEVVPFWVLAFVGWAFSTVCVYLMQRYAIDHDFSHSAKTFWVAFVNLSAYGLLWVGKFMIFNKVMFVHHHHLDDAKPEPVAAEETRPAGAA